MRKTLAPALFSTMVLGCLLPAPALAQRRVVYYNSPYYTTSSASAAAAGLAPFDFWSTLLGPGISLLDQQFGSTNVTPQLTVKDILQLFQNLTNQNQTNQNQQTSVQLPPAKTLPTTRPEITFIQGQISQIAANLGWKDSDYPSKTQFVAPPSPCAQVVTTPLKEATNCPIAIPAGGPT
jgi:hypothetical protein